MNETKSHSFIIQTDDDVKITRVLYTSPDLDSYIKENTTLLPIILPENTGRFLQFLLDVKEYGEALSREITLQIDSKSEVFKFFGVYKNSSYIMLCFVDYPNMYDKLSSINNELVNYLRERFKSKYINSEISEMTIINNELINVRRELSKTNMELKKILQEKNELLGILVHDLRNPLSSIIGFTSILQEHDRIEKEQMENILNLIQGSSEHMLYILTNVLDISKIESGTLELRKDRTIYNHLVKNSLEYNSILAQPKNISFSSSIPEEDLNLTIDREKIRQVFDNLINNAIKYSYPDTTIAITIEKTKNTVVTSIEDCGVGIPKNEQHLLFKPFQTTSARPTSQNDKSTGLGLAIVKKIIDAHQGNVWIESEKGKGTTIYYSLPLT